MFQFLNYKNAYTYIYYLFISYTYTLYIICLYIYKNVYILIKLIILIWKVLNPEIPYIGINETQSVQK